jgi:hypothetical protein
MPGCWPVTWTSSARYRRRTPLAAIFLAYGGTGEGREQRLRQAGEFSDGLSNATVSAAWQIAWADSLVERGRLAEALDIAVPAAVDPQVMPTVRLLGTGRPRTPVAVARGCRGSDFAPQRAGSHDVELARAIQ